MELSEGSYAVLPAAVVVGSAPNRKLFILGEKDTFNKFTLLFCALKGFSSQVRNKSLKVNVSHRLQKKR